MYQQDHGKVNLKAPATPILCPNFINRATMRREPLIWPQGVESIWGLSPSFCLWMFVVALRVNMPGRVNGAG